MKTPKINLFALMIISVLMVFDIALYAQADTTKTVHLYILMGQSNMAGRGKISDDYKNISHPRVLMLDKELNWVLAKHPLHFDKPKVSGVGPGLAFAMKMAEENPNIIIGLIPCAVGGTSINYWQPAAFDKATQTHPYDDALARIKAASSKGVFKGVIWHQGEADSSPEKASTYANKLSVLVTRIREETQNNKLPWVIGELGRYRENYQHINKVLADIHQNIPFTAVANSKDLIHNGDNTHFDSKSANILGERMAKKMIKLQKKIK
ncbi:carbohydrate acetyl esterase/feruloyl esterase [Pedobacter glucosidilyticus]|nr:sialate O-acetylesterase [Pedobacter glucosidilyticus]KHJ36703.1 carbohydrate acetyl esterase/feruloyl esterase [Pedobacter glucosidilyticus]